MMALKNRWLKLVLTLWISQSLANSAEEPAYECKSENPKCYVVILENALKDPLRKNIDNAIRLISMSNSDVNWKNNAIGLLYMFRKDHDSYIKAEVLFLDALKKGVRGAAQNLAELYFLREDIEKSFKYIKLVESYNYEFPKIQYLNWARLYGQLLYLHGNSIQEKNDGISLLKKIQKYDESGVADYIVGFYEFEQGDVGSGLNLLEKASRVGVLDATLLLGDIYYTGNQVTQKIEKGKEYYLLAAIKDSGKAHYNLFVIYKEEGNVDEMRKHLALATNLGNKSALDLWGRLKKSKDNQL